MPKKEEQQLPAKRSALQRAWLRASIAFSKKDLLLFTKYLTVLLRSGVSIDEALIILQKRTSSSAKKILSILLDHVQHGNPLSAGLEEMPWIFDTVYVNLTRAGEGSGTLVESLEQLTVQMEKDIDLRKKVKSAMIYPAIVLLAAISVTVAIMIFVIPNVTTIFSSINAELPASTRFMIWLSEFIQTKWSWILVGTGGLIVLVMASFRISWLQPISHTIALKFPIVGKIVQKINLARLTRLLGTLLRSGVTIDEAIPITMTIVQNVRYKKMLMDVEQQVSQGVTFAEVLSHYESLVPSIPQQIVGVGEKTGSLDDLLIYLADFYDQEVGDVMKSLTIILEPLLTIFIGLIVGMVALAILTPIYSLVGQL